MPTAALVGASLALALTTAPPPAQDPVLLSDINAAQTSGPLDSDPALVTGLFGDLWLRADRDPWRFDPVTGEAERLTNLSDLAAPAIPLGAGRAILRLQAPTVFVGQLVVSDGTASGTEVLLSGGAYALKSDPFEWNGSVYFFYRSASNKTELWTTDGTVAGTSAVQTFSGAPPNNADIQFALSGGALYFSDSTATGLARLASPTAPLEELNTTGSYVQAELDSAVTVGGRLVFPGVTAALGREPWASDGTPAGTTLLRDIRTGSSSSAVRMLAADSNRAWFSATGDFTGNELWITDGTSAGTGLVVDLIPGDVGSLPVDLGLPGAPAAILPGGDLLFTAGQNPTVFGQVFDLELYRSDGTPSGTRRVADLVPGADFGSRPVDFVQVAGTTYFTADSANFFDRDLYRTDGTAAGTTQVIGAATASVRLYSALDELWITAYLDDVGVELLRSDGTSAGTVLAKNFVPEPTGDAIANSHAFRPVRLGDEIFFQGRSAAAGAELWATDGTPGGTRQVADLAPGTADSFARPEVALGGRLIFTTDTDGRFVWSTDGTAAGTVALTDSTTTPFPVEFVRFRDLVLFKAQPLLTGGRDQLWRTDGTPAGTAFISEITTNPFSQTNGLEDSVELGGFLYFHGRDAANVRSVWRTDGTTAGTGVFAPIPNSFFDPGSPRTFARLADRIYFVGPDGASSGEALWSLDGTAGGTAPVFVFDGAAPRSFTRLGERLIYTTQFSSVGSEPWATDGTAAGTVLLADILPAGSSFPSDFAAIGDAVYFTATVSNNYERQFWSTDGTPAGTAALPDLLNLGLANDSEIRDFGSLEQLVYTGSTLQTGRELWLHDPVSGAQTLIADVWPGPAESLPGRAVELGGRLIFDARSETLGRELFAVDLPQLGTGGSEPFGQGCSLAAPAAEARLFGPVAPGSAPDLLLEQAPPGAIALAYRSAPVAPLDLGSGCAIYLDLAAARLLTAGTADASGALRSPVAIPPNPSLSGAAQTLQFVFADSSGPLLGSLGLSNAIDVVIL